MRVRSVNEEVMFADEGIVWVAREDIELLKERASNSERKRMRLCTHKDVGDRLHEMLIVHTRDTYVRPHKHLNKIESFHIIEGTVNVVIFDEMGDIRDVIRMGGYASGRPFYYRIDQPYYHALVITSNVLVFHETTNGPLDRSDTVFAPWAPEEGDTQGVSKFREDLSRRMKAEGKR